MAQCKEAVALHNEYRSQLIANKRLDFEIARLKNCGELKIAGIEYASTSIYHKLCEDVIVSPPKNQVLPHTHKLKSGNTD